MELSDKKTRVMDDDGLCVVEDLFCLTYNMHHLQYAQRGGPQAGSFSTKSTHVSNVGLTSGCSGCRVKCFFILCKISRVIEPNALLNKHDLLLIFLFFCFCNTLLLYAGEIINLSV